MRIILGVITASLLASGCVTTYGESPEAICANGGMRYGGFTVTQKDDAGNNRGHLQCETPTNAIENCEVKKQSEIAATKQAFNSRWILPNYVIGTGLVFYVLPGIAARYYYQDDYKLDGQATQAKIAEIESRSCETIAH